MKNHLSDQVLFTTAKLACKELKEHISGERILDAAEVEGHKALIKTASRKSLYFFAKVVLGFDKLTARTHKRWADDLQASWLETDYFGRLKPRGTFKTTLYGEAFMLWVWATVSPRIRFFYTSANQTLLEEVAAHLDFYLSFDSSSLYAYVYGITRDKTARKNTETVFNVRGRDPSAKGSSLTFRTAGGSTNGLHPHFIIIDDPCDKDDRESVATRRSKERWFDSLIPLLVPFEWKVYEGDKVVKTITIQKMLMVATRWHLDDLINYVMKKSDDWDLEVEGVYDENGAPMYPEFFGEEQIAKVKSKISEVFFACQYLNNPLPEGVQIFSVKRLHFVRPEQYDIREGGNYCFFDPSQGKQGSDYPAVIWINLLNGRKVLFDNIDQKMELTGLIHLIAKYNLEFRSKVMVFETNGAMGLQDSIVRAHKEVGYPIAIDPINETRNKTERIQCMQPDLYRGEILFRTDYAQAYPELMNQIVYFPSWGNDDFPDVVEKAIGWFNRNLPASFYQGSSGPAASKTLAGSLRNRSA